MFILETLRCSEKCYQIWIYLAFWFLSVLTEIICTLRYKHSYKRGWTNKWTRLGTPKNNFLLSFFYQSQIAKEWSMFFLSFTWFYGSTEHDKSILNLIVNQKHKKRRQEDTPYGSHIFRSWPVSLFILVFPKLTSRRLIIWTLSFSVLSSRTPNWSQDCQGRMRPELI